MSLAALPDDDCAGDRGLTVALMGRTTAGKSTILEALTHGDGSRQGRGAQRTTRDVHRETARELPGIILVDTPGVGAHDGQADFETAFAQVPDADLILWVAANDSQQEETTRALRTLALAGKPIVMALNCRYPIDDLDGVLNDNGRVFLAYPQVAFDESDDHARVLARHMARAGVPQVTVVPVHARAAHLATMGIAEAAQLRQASRIDDLVALLSDHANSVTQVQLRALRAADRVREPVTAARASLLPTIPAARAQVHRQRETVLDAARRMRRAVDREEARLHQEVAGPIDRRRRWHESADPGPGVRDAWAAEAKALGRELTGVLEAGEERLRRALEEALDQAVRDWADLPMPELDDASFTSFDSVLWNRIAKIGTGVGAGALAWVAAGAAAGLAAGPLGMALGAAAGLLVGGIGSQVTRWVGGLFKSRDRVRRERREQLGRALKPKLDDLARDAATQASRIAAVRREQVAEWRGSQLDALAGADRRITRWDQLGEHLGEVTSELDLATARALLDAAGRTRASRGAVRAVRGPAAIAVEMAEPAFSEAALFPVHPTPLPIVVAPDHSPRSPGQALNLMAQLAPDQVQCLGISASAVALRVRGPQLADGVLDSWESMLCDFTGSRVTLVREAGTGGSPNTGEGERTTGGAGANAGPPTAPGQPLGQPPGQPFDPPFDPPSGPPFGQPFDPPFDPARNAA